MNHVQDHLQREGRAYYKRGEYATALDYFDRAIGRGATISLLDNRAACHEKLDEYPAALKDAKKAIQLQREDPTGYLRAGKVLLKMEKQSVAFEIYTHGLKCVKHVGQGYEVRLPVSKRYAYVVVTNYYKLLRKAHEDLRALLFHPTSVDPLTVLPRELAELILGQLTFQQRINACLVSKAWAAFIRSSPSLWEHLDLSNARKNVRTAFISRAINVGRHKLSKATLTKLYDFEKVLAALIRHCPLEDLTISNAGIQSTSLADELKNATSLTRFRLTKDTTVGRHTVSQLISVLAPRLHELHIPLTDGNLLFAGQWSEHITTLNVYVTSNSIAWIGRLSNTMPSLQTLTAFQKGTLDNVELVLMELHKLVDLDLYLDCARGYLRSCLLPPSLRKLRLVTGLRWDGVDDEDIKVLPDLEYLSIGGQDMTEWILPALVVGVEPERLSPPGLRDFSRLRELYIDGGTFLPVLSTANKSGRLADLRSLTLRNVEVLANASIVEIPRLCPLLQRIDLSCTAITGDDILRLIPLACLKEFVLNDCPYIRRDTVDYLRSRNYVVHAKKTAQEQGGRKVRW
jgi:F-box/TPR repeat protein Pof3